MKIPFKQKETYVYTTKKMKSIIKKFRDLEPGNYDIITWECINKTVVLTLESRNKPGNPTHVWLPDRFLESLLQKQPRSIYYYGLMQSSKNPYRSYYSIFF